MRENFEQIYQYAWKIWRWRWIALGIAAIVCAAGWAVVANMPDKYESMARVLFPPSIIKQILDDAGMLTSDLDESKKVEAISKTLLNRSNLEKIIREADLDLNVHTPAEKESLFKALAAQIEMTGNIKDSIYIIRYQNSDSALAKRVVESSLNIFLESVVGTGMGGKTTKFLKKEIEGEEFRLEAAEERLKEFKIKNLGLLPTETGGYVATFQGAKDERYQAKLSLSEAIQRRGALESRLSGVLPIVPMDPDAAAEVLRGEISVMERRQDALVMQFTDRHPDVIDVRQALVTLKEQLETELLNPKESNRGGVENPIYQELTIELGRVEAEVAALRARKRGWERKVSNLERLATKAPEVEAGLIKLTRNYQIIKDNRDGLVIALEKLIRELKAGVQFQIIDPPVESIAPVGPNRPLFMSIVLLAGLGCGIAFALLLTQLRPTFDRATELSSGTGLPVYGSISMVLEESQLSKNKSNTIIFSLGVLALFAAYGVVVAMQFLA